MDETQNECIDLKFLLYRIMRAWKPIVACTVLISLLIGIGGVALNAVKLLDEEFMEESRLDFEREHASWVATEENLLFQLDNLEKAKERQLEYNQKSILMDIDPLKKNVASCQLHVKYEPQLLGQFQIKDLSDTILSSYATYMTNGEMYNYIRENLSYDIESRYLGEILGISVDYDTNMISASVVHVDAAKCQEILSLVESGIRSRYQSVCDNVDIHEIVSNNGAAYETIDLSLQDTQESNLQYITDIDIEIQSVNEQLGEWKKQPEPQYEYTVFEIVKGGIKFTIIGGLIGFAVLCAVVAIFTVLSGKLLNPEDMKNRFGIRVIGILPAIRAKKAFDSISNKIAAIGGIKARNKDFEALAQMIGSSIRSDIISRGDGQVTKNIVFTGMSKCEDIDRAISSMELDGYNIVCAPDILTNALSIDKLSCADYVVLAETQEKSSFSDIAKELEAIRAWNKPIVGAVVLNCDSII